MDETLQRSLVFQTFAMILNTMNKALLLLAEKGADRRTLSFMVKNINSLIANINEYAGDIDMEDTWNKELNQICERYNISRADNNGEDEE